MGLEVVGIVRGCGRVGLQLNQECDTSETGKAGRPARRIESTLQRVALPVSLLTLALQTQKEARQSSDRPKVLARLLASLPA